MVPLSIFQWFLQGVRLLSEVKKKEIKGVKTKDVDGIKDGIKTFPRKI